MPLPSLNIEARKSPKKHYIVKPALAPDSSHILEQLGASPTTTDPERRDHGPPREAQTDTNECLTPRSADRPPPTNVVARPGVCGGFRG